MKPVTGMLVAGIGLLGWFVFKKSRPVLPRPAPDGNIYDYDVEAAERDNIAALKQMQDMREAYGWPDADASVLVNARDRR